MHVHTGNATSARNDCSSIIACARVAAKSRWNCDAETRTALAQSFHYIFDHNDAHAARVAGAKHAIHVVVHPGLRREVELRHRNLKHIAME